MKHVVILGGGADLAKPIIEYYLTKLCRVTALCRDKTNIISTARPSHYNVQICPNWTTQFEHVSSIDLLITLPGSVKNVKLEDMSEQDWNQIIEDNLTSVFKGVRGALPKLALESNIVIVGSIVGKLGGYGCTNYAAAKAGLVGLVRSLAKEVAARKICVNLLELGYVNAGMGTRLPPVVRDSILSSIPLRRFAEPNEVVQAIDFLGSTRYMTGDVLTLAGGLH